MIHYSIITYFILGKWWIIELHFQVVCKMWHTVQWLILHSASLDLWASYIFAALKSSGLSLLCHRYKCANFTSHVNLLSLGNTELLYICTHCKVRYWTPNLCLMLKLLTWTSLGFAGWTTDMVYPRIYMEL